MHWASSDWELVLLYDESPFELMRRKIRGIALKPDEKRFHPDCVQKLVKFRCVKLIL